MSVQVYIISDPELIECVENNDIDGFRQKLADCDTYYFAEPETFDTESEALAFCGGIGYGIDERAPATRLPLISSNDYYIPFIDAIKEY